MADELIDVVNEKDEVVGTSMKLDAHATGMRVRIIHVFIFDSNGRMALQLRSKNVDHRPGHWTSAGSGHIAAGESYETAGARELLEETGIRVPLTFMGTELYRKPNGAEEFLGVMRGTYDGNVTAFSKEVERIEFFSTREIMDMVKRGEKFHEEFLFLLKKRFGISL